MKIAVLGTGGGARCHIAKLLELGHEVVVGTRDPQATLARTEPDMMGNPPFQQFLAEHPGITLLPFGEAAAAADELVISGIDGHNAVAALTVIADQLTGKTLIDYAVPFVYQHEPEHPWPTPWGIMPKLEPVDTDSLGEQIQRALPRTRVVKSFVTQEQSTVVNPAGVGGGDHTMFVAGDHADAKQQTAALLKSYGWTDILDLGPLVAARGMEMYAHMHSAIGFGLGQQFGGHFGIKVVR
ncbi:putative dinucleotide-binding enzyme [Streptomyces griseochromogenes]|uniref:Dinucleotide-binding enzyme n=1 Tax=Streptomyces griseochromogenes TaxID=68214 RepID=A0A1B1B0U4_9ACTN|nr:NAD(P)-binding domain-containing protein [Streptomyces griseochromogenes]ANP52420.1 NADP oxidoreductase [Streptomyces griseochromogenes]MBP2055336.1 putative dinucleotide-binding enzyme [Streptomyces griseochromogenes]